MAQDQNKPQEFSEELPEDTGSVESEAPEIGSDPLPEDETENSASLRAEVADLKDRLLRALAEAENIRKRADRDRRDAEQYGITRFARDLLSVHDNFERAMKHADDEARSAAGPLLEGIELTQRELLSALAKHGIRKISPERGERFDPKLHQAMFEAPVPGTKSGDIIEVMNEGFTIGERLLRPAQVGVSSGGPAISKPEAEPATAATSGDEESGEPVSG